MTTSISASRAPTRQPAAIAVKGAVNARGVANVDSGGAHVGATAKVPASSTKVTLSAAGLAASAANREAAETPAQTAQEAQGNDVQAKRLLAKEQATAKAARG